MSDSGLNGRIAILVVSCDAYSDLWPPFFSLFNRFWVDCPHRLYLCSNHKPHTAPGLTSLLVGPDTSWSGNVIRALGHVEEDYVLLLLDDLLLTKRVDNSAVQDTFRWFIESGGDCIRMNPTPPPDRRPSEAGAPTHIGISSPGTLYRVSTVATLWRKQSLVRLLKEGESAWDFEVQGTIRSDSSAGFYASRRTHFNILNSVVKGKWVPSALRKTAALGISPGDSRPVMNWRELINLRLALVRSKVLHILPAPWRRSIKDRILGGKYEYKISK
jgi:hypothetical protein